MLAIFRRPPSIEFTSLSLLLFLLKELLETLYLRYIRNKKLHQGYSIPGVFFIDKLKRNEENKSRNPPKQLRLRSETRRIPSCCLDSGVHQCD